jgi:predicted phage tail protein
VTVTNQMTNFGWEYIWHCHILSHEEHDMMRAIGFAVPPKAPGSLTAARSSNRVRLTWTSTSPLITTGFTLERATNSTFTTGLTRFNLGKVTAFTDPSSNVNSIYFYRLSALNTIGAAVAGYPTMTAESPYATAIYGSAPSAPTNLSATVLTSSSVRLNWTDTANNESGFNVERCLGAGCTNFAPLLGTLAANTRVFTDNTVSVGQTYVYRVSAVNAVGPSAFVTVATTVGVPAAPTSLALTVINRQVRLNWTDNSNNEAGFTIQRATNAAFTTGLATNTVGANVTTFLTPNLTRGVTYFFRVTATNSLGASVPVTASVLVP